MSAAGIEKLKISNFRSYKVLELYFDSNPTVIYGKNGVGKTNLLEAISLLYPGKGIRRSSFHDMINLSNNISWKVEALAHRNNNRFEIETSSDGYGRVVRIDGKKVPQNNLSSSLKIIWFLPPMDRIWMETSKDRRKFLDRMVFSLDINHAKRCAQYEKLLRDRNRLLKDRIEDSSWYLAIEKEMAILGFEIDNCRRDFIGKLNTVLIEKNNYFPLIKLNLKDDPIESEEVFLKNLINHRGQDLVSGRTNFGPHSDDLQGFYLDKEIDIKYCSTGEQKLSIISIILSNAKLIKEQHKVSPIMLLDEITAHLDEARKENLFSELLSLETQFFISGTEVGIFSSLRKKTKFLELDERKKFVA
ncbi:DNA replication/repair protein RecF [Paracoccaceae bacterium]|nr:DNA replication/repair protein RecF [Paracoccaceae bacterium]